MAVTGLVGLALFLGCVIGAGVLLLVRRGADYGRWSPVITALGCGIVNAAYLLASGASADAWLLLYGYYAAAGLPFILARVAGDLYAQHRALVSTTPKDNENASGTPLD